jgi:hypothetical protein
MYNYDWQGIGLKIITPSGTAFLAGEEGSELYDQLEEAQTDEEIEAILSEYEHICE